MPRSNKAAAAVVAAVGVLVAVFFACSMVRGFSFSSVIGILIGLSAAGRQLRNLFKDNETEVDEEWF